MNPNQIEEFINEAGFVGAPGFYKWAVEHTPLTTMDPPPPSDMEGTYGLTCVDEDDKPIIRIIVSTHDDATLPDEYLAWQRMKAADAGVALYRVRSDDSRELLAPAPLAGS
jgi:hypothetical protein